MVDIVLFQPEIPANTGNIARTCAASGARLSLIKPLGFDISEKAVRRAGLDYWHLVDITVYESLDDFFLRHSCENLWLSSTKGKILYSDADFTPNVTLMFGRETAGLPKSIMEQFSNKIIRIPMKDEARSLNLSNCAALLCYEALRQQGFTGLHF